MELPIYKIIFDEDASEGVFGVSLVESPANQAAFIAMKDEVVQLKVKDEDKRLVTGVVLIPNQMIFRNSKSYGEHYITFDKDTIERLSFNFFESKSNGRSWYEHDYDKSIDTTVVESWIVNDPSKDKALTLGFTDIVEGTWMMTMKLSEKDWTEYVKTGKVKGFSIDGYLRQELIINNEIQMNEKLNSILSMLKAQIKNEIELLSIEVDGVVLEATSFEEGAIVYVEGEPHRDAEFVYRDLVYKTDADGVITDVEEVVVEEEEIVELEDVEVSLEDAKAIIESLLEDNEELEAWLLDKLEIVAVDVAIDQYEEDEETRNKIHNLFSKERKALEEKITALTKEIETIPNTTKLKAHGVVRSDVRVNETTLEAIRRINSLNK